MKRGTRGNGPVGPSRGKGGPNTGVGRGKGRARKSAHEIMEDA